MNRLCVLAAGKVNRFLHITGRRADGYHLLETLGRAGLARRMCGSPDAHVAALDVDRGDRAAG